ncbi:hypothetical protein ACMDCT_08885 [Halomonadaceae bacterium KBTZ08]
MQPAGQDWNLSSSLPLATLVMALAAGSWGVFAALVTLVSQTFELSAPQFGLTLAVPAFVSTLLVWPLYRWAVHAANPGTVLLVVFLALTPSLAGLSLATRFSHLLLVGTGLGLVPGCFAIGLVYLRRLTLIPCRILATGLLTLCLLGIVFAYASTPLISEAFGWRFTPLMSIGLIVIAASLLATLGEAPENNV